LKQLFDDVVVKKDKLNFIHPFYHGFECFFDNRGYVEEFHLNGHVAMHITLKKKIHPQKEWHRASACILFK
jgi:ribosomal protein L31